MLDTLGRKDGKAALKLHFFQLAVAKHIILQPPTVRGVVIHRAERLSDISEVLIVL